ncbi:MAG: XTP/dITP diphosphatase [Candidatus Omnitrophica bacterium]|nr:XTP/dITP diphosphatase [Candidatus Omnitrophota bacterium]
MLEIVISSRNKEKKRELKALLKGLGIKVLDLNDLPAAPDVKETGKTFEANARLKALKIAKYTKRLALADDSGLVVKALGGRPGVRSARFAGDKADYSDNNRKLLKLLKDVQGHKRGAKFVSVVALAGPEGIKGVVRGECSGRITLAPKGRNGFGYDPIFFSPKFGKTFAELSASQKNSISHRGRALKKARAVILRLRRSRS